MQVNPGSPTTPQAPNADEDKTGTEGEGTGTDAGSTNTDAGTTESEKD